MNKTFHKSYLKQALLIGATICLPQFGMGQEMLSDDDRKDAVSWLKNLKSGHLNSSSARLAKAVEELTTASSSEANAMKLYMNAMKEQFMNPTNAMSNMLSRGSGRMRGNMGGNRANGRNSNNGKSESPATAFSNWRKQNSGNNIDPGFKKALQLQCKWMLLCLKKATAEKREEDIDITNSVMSMMGEVANNAKEVGSQLSMVSGASNVIRQYLKISDYRSETLPDNLMDFNSIFDQVLLAPHKESKNISQFRQIWNRRIQLELLLMESGYTGNKKALNEEKSAFLTTRQWEREKACFELGDQVQALSNMKQILPNLKDPSVKQRAIKDLEFMLLSPAEQKNIRDKQRKAFEERIRGFAPPRM